MSAKAANIAIEKLRRQCLLSGLDLVQPFRIQSYNVTKEAAFRIPEFGRNETLGALIGNTSFIWDFFLKYLSENPEKIEEEHPLNTYVTREVQEALEGLPEKTEARFSYEKKPHFVPLQSICALSGLAPLKAGMLNVHPVYGPWIALRAVICFDISAEGLEPAPAPSLPSGWEEDCESAFQAACNAAGAHPDHFSVKESWRLWVKVRDACPIGKEHRYSEDQILYHHTHDREILRRAIATR